MSWAPLWSVQVASSGSWGSESQGHHTREADPTSQASVLRIAPTSTWRPHPQCGLGGGDLKQGRKKTALGSHPRSNNTGIPDAPRFTATSSPLGGASSRLATWLRLDRPRLPNTPIHSRLPTVPLISAFPHRGPPASADVDSEKGVCCQDPPPIRSQMTFVPISATLQGDIIIPVLLKSFQYEMW